MSGFAPARLVSGLTRLVTHADVELDNLVDEGTPRDGAQRRQSRWTISSWVARRFRPSKIVLMMQRTLLRLPVYVLIVLGLIHVLEALVGRSDLGRTSTTYADYLRLWNPPITHDVEVDIARFQEEAFNGAVPIPCHSHNDYWRKAPLFSAIQWGCMGVEADVWLYDDDLFVGHTTFTLKRDRTFRNLYVDPLVDLLDKKNSRNEFTTDSTGDLSPRGVFDQDPSQTLVVLIDLKTSGEETFLALQQQLTSLRERDYLSYWNGTGFNPRPVTVVGTGNTPFDLILANSTYRDIFYDAPLDKMWVTPHTPISQSDTLSHLSDATLSYGDAMAFLPDPAPSSLSRRSIGDQPSFVFNSSTSYYASISFTKAVGFVWRGHLSPRQMEIIRGQVRGAKLAGLKARYWGVPNWPIALRNHLWHVLAKEGVDFLNVDDLRAAAVENWKARTFGLW